VFILSALSLKISVFEDKPKGSIRTLDNRPTHNILVCLPNTSIDTQLVWEGITTRSIVNIRVNVQLIFVTNEIPISSSNLARREVTITNMKFICKVCEDIHPVYTPIPMEKIKSSSLRNMENPVPQTWLINSYYVSDTEMSKFDPSRRIFPFRDTLDRVYELLSCIVPNASLTADYNEDIWLDIKENPNRTVWLQDLLLSRRIPFTVDHEDIGIHALLHKQKDFTFLICSPPISEAVSISALVSVFDLKIWILIIAFILI